MKLLTRLALAAALTAGAASAADKAAAPIPAVAAVPAADAAPDVVVKALYESYFAALNAAYNEPNQGPDWMSASKPYMTPELAARMDKMEASGEAGIDVDMLVAGQDYQDLKVDSVTVTASDATTATVRVAFTSMGTATNSDVKMSKTAAGWRIADIVTNAGTPEEYSVTKGLTDLGL